MDDVEDEDWIEDEIEKQLAGIDVYQNSDTDDDDNLDLNSLDVPQEEPVFDIADLYVNSVTKRTEILADELEECDNILQLINNKRYDDDEDEELLQFAKTEGVDVKTWKQKILEELDAEDEEEREDEHRNESTFITETVVISQSESGQRSGDCVAMVTVSDAERLERELKLQLSNWITEKRHKDADKMKVVHELLSSDREKFEISESTWKKKWEDVRTENSQIQQQSKDEYEASDEAVNQTWQTIQSRLQRHQAVELKKLEDVLKVTATEHQELQREADDCLEELRFSAALKIQTKYRQHRVYHEFGELVKQRIFDMKSKRYIARIEEIERLRITEENRKKDEKMKMIKEEEAEREKREEDERKKREEAERKKQVQLEEKRLKEEEKKRKAEEELQKKEERERKEKEEKQTKENEKRERREKEELQKKEERERKEKEEREREKEAEEEKNRKEKEESERKESERKEKEERERKKREERERKDKEERERKENEEKQRLKEKQEICNVKLEEDCKARDAEKNRQDRLESQRPLPPCLSNEVQQRRLKWMQDCIPWSKVMMEQKNKILPETGKRNRRRPSSAKHLRQLPDNVILQSAQVATLQLITTVTLTDLPGYSLSALSRCKLLKSLTMTRCNLVSVDGLHECVQLVYLNCQENDLEHVNLKAMSHLMYVNLSRNKLTTIHGFDGCHGVKFLDLSHNKITRCDGLAHLRALWHLDLSHNNILRCDGLCEVARLQRLNISHNNLQSLGDIENLCLLQTIDASSNNIQKCPSLSNHVLLQQLLLNDNSISSINKISVAWLPLLWCLHVHKNSLCEVTDINKCLNLTEINISHNQFMDVNSAVAGIRNCRLLKCVDVTENPLIDLDADWRETLLRDLRFIETLNGEFLSKRVDDCSRQLSEFEAMCSSQINEHFKLDEKYIREERLILGKKKIQYSYLIRIMTDYYNKSHDLAVEHRYSHEYGDIKTTETPIVNSDIRRHLDHVDTSVDVGAETCGTRFEASPAVKDQSAANVIDAKSKFEALFSSNNNVARKPSLGMKSSRKSPSKKSSIIDLAATIIQANWRGYWVRKQLLNSVVNGDNYYHGNGIDNDELSFLLKELHLSATKIQTAWRGFIVRKRLQMALRYARLQEGSALDEYGEVDMTMFDFNEDDLDCDWLPSSVPEIPNHHAVLPPPLLQLYAPHPPSEPRPAWRNNDTDSVSDTMVTGRPPRAPSSMDSQRTGLSRKAEVLSQEWGFKDARTAELMLQRAKKLKYNVDRKKKLDKLDPKQRLQLFRKLEEVNKPPLVTSRKPAPARKEYFQEVSARWRHPSSKEDERQQEVANRTLRMYEWLHTAAPPLGDRLRHHGSESNLPVLQDDVLSGGRVRLVGSPVFMEVESVSDQRSDISRPAGRRHSFANETANINKASSLQFPPIKTNSAPSGVKKKKEKISWRGPKQDIGVGWGAGKKRASNQR